MVLGTTEMMTPSTVFDVTATSSEPAGARQPRSCLMAPDNGWDEAREMNESPETRSLAGAASSSRHVFAQSSLHKCCCSNPAFCRHRYDTELQDRHAVAQGLYPALGWRHYAQTQLGQRQDDEEPRLLSAVHNCFSRGSLLKVIACSNVN